MKKTKSSRPPKRKTPTFRYGINWELLEELIRNQESVTSMLHRTPGPECAYYYAKKYGQVFPTRVRHIIAELDLPLSVVRQIIIETKSP